MIPDYIKDLHERRPYNKSKKYYEGLFYPSKRRHDDRRRRRMRRDAGRHEDRDLKYWEGHLELPERQYD
jgi:hypothetical protein